MRVAHTQRTGYERRSFMFFLLIKALLLHPALLRQHIANYAQWLQAEVHYGMRHLIIALCAWAACAAALFLALVLAGIAAMLGVLHNQHHWALIAIPCVPLVAAFVAFLVAHSSQKKLKGLNRLKQQIQADIAVFQRARSQ